MEGGTADRRVVGVRTEEDGESGVRLGKKRL